MLDFFMADQLCSQVGVSDKNSILAAEQCQTSTAEYKVSKFTDGFCYCAGANAQEP